MRSILEYPFITPYNHAIYASTLGAHKTDAIFSPLFQWLLNGKIAENPVITPGTEVQVVRPSGANRYLETVTVEAVSTTA